MFVGDRRVEEDFKALWVLAVDDVGPKIDAAAVEALLGEPTFRIETSRDNFQWGYRLEAPIVHVGVARALVHAVRVALTGPGGQDPGMEGVTRYMRLPVGRNGKGGADWTVRSEWTGRVMTEQEVEGLRGRLGVAADDDPSWSQDKAAVRGPAGTGDIDEGDPFLKAFRELGRVLSQPRDSMGWGVDVRCPWDEEHTDRADSGTFFAPGRGFRCHHGHCAGRGLPDLRERLTELVIEDSGGLVTTLAQIDFDDVDLADPVLGRLIPVGNSPRFAADVAGEFVERHVHELRQDHTSDNTLVRDQRKGWRTDVTGSAFDWALRACKRRFQQQQKEGSMDRISDAVSIERAARAILKIARHDPRIATTIHDWDNDPVAMSAAGVHVDLRTGSTRPLEPTDLMLRRASVPPVRIPTPIWDKFMWETFDGDTDLITFVHQWFGYCLSGDTSAEKLAFLHGTGGNGKGVVIHTVSEIAGSYAVMLGSDMFMQRKHEEHPTEIARLAGARMAIGSEISDGARWNLRRLKELTGHEGNLHGRFMRRDFFEFKPTHKLTLVGNHKPAIGHVDPAIARRLLMLPFEHMPKKMDPSLKDRLVPEYPGILWKLIEGCGEVLAALADGGAGFGSLIPQAVVKASREYFVEEDNVALWMSEQCEAGTGYSMMSNEAHTNYEAWCGDEGLPPVSQRMFKDAAVRAAEIAGMSITCRRTKKGVVLVGARLKPVN